MRLINLWTLISLLLWALTGWAHLPKSVNIVSGVPLTLPEQTLKRMGLKPQENTGGWGDVMANVGMALELKKQFPEVQVRLIVTLNDEETRPYVNKVREFIPKTMKNDSGITYLNPDSKEKQFYQGVEIYFVSVPGSLAYRDPPQLTPTDKLSVMNSVSHIPDADLGLQYSANNSPVSSLVVKGKKMHLYFEEYSYLTESHAYTFLQNGKTQIKLNSGPLGFGVYGFGSKSDSRGGVENKKYIESWLVETTKSNPAMQNFDLRSGKYDLAFAYAGDPEMIEDYVKAVESMASKAPKNPTIIVYKGSGSILINKNVILLPVGAHPKELGHALISESTYSPLVTGDGSLSSALETMSKTKSFLYENIEWKVLAMDALITKVFSKDAASAEMAKRALIPLTRSLNDLGMSRENRVALIQSVLQNNDVHNQWHSYFSRRTAALNIADNTLNIFQFAEIFEALQKGFQNGKFYSLPYLVWLVELVKTFSVRDGLPVERLKSELTDKVYGKSKNLSEKWNALFTLWETGHTVSTREVNTVVAETALFLKQRKTDSNYQSESDIFGILEQINGSRKSKYALYKALEKDPTTYAYFSEIRKGYDAQNTKPLRLLRKNSCEGFYSK
jgi:hypothetical protein